MLEKVQGIVIQGASTQNVLPSSTSSPWEPALIGATIGFVGAITAQIVSHFFTQRRETQKFNKEIYQNLFAPVLLDVYSYLDIVTHFRKHHDLKYGVNESDIRDKIINHIGTNLKYASPNLILSYEAVLRNDYEEDFSGYLSSISDLDLLLQFLDDLYELNQRTKLFDEAKTRKINKYRVLYLIWVFLARYESQGVEKSASQVAYKFYFSSERLTAKFYDEVKNYTGDQREKLNFILKSLIREEYTNEVNDVFFPKQIENNHEQLEQTVQVDLSGYRSTFTARERREYRKRQLVFVYNEIFYEGKSKLILEPEDISQDFELVQAYDYLHEKGLISKSSSEQDNAIEITITARGIDVVEKNSDL